MIYERIEGFTERLLENTKESKLQWMPFSSFRKKADLYRELDSGFAGIDFGMNSIRESESYYLNVKDGYVFLFEIYHGDPEVTSPELDSLALMVKINGFLPLDNLSSHVDCEEHQELLATLKLRVEHYLEDKYCMPDVLYKFMDSVFEEE